MKFRFLVLLLLAGSKIYAAERPNILLIYTDDHSYRTVSCYPQAYSFCNTPNIDALAERGVRFEYAYIGTWCMPSRATMLTGHHQFGVQSMRMEGQYPGSEYDPEKCPFWPSVFRKNGYTTCQIGKWHTGHVCMLCHIYLRTRTLAFPRLHTFPLSFFFLFSLTE